MALVARDGRFTLPTRRWGEFLGRGRRKAAGVPRVGDVTHPDDMPATAEALRRMAAGELPEWNAEKRYVRPSGEVRWGALRALLLPTPTAGPALPGAPARRHRPAAGGRRRSARSASADHGRRRAAERGAAGAGRDRRARARLRARGAVAGRRDGAASRADWPPRRRRQPPALPRATSRLWHRHPDGERRRHDRPVGSAARPGRRRRLAGFARRSGRRSASSSCASAPRSCCSTRRCTTR